MDPDACWERLVRHLNAMTDDPDAHDEMTAAARDLYQWLKRGGFMPAALESLGFNRKGARVLLFNLFD